MSRPRPVGLGAAVQVTPPSGDTPYGFQWDHITVERTARFGTNRDTYVLAIKTPRREINVYVSPTGLIRVFDKTGREWTQP